jgi:hypothetical protein
MFLKIFPIDGLFLTTDDLFKHICLDGSQKQTLNNDQ